VPAYVDSSDACGIGRAKVFHKAGFSLATGPMVFGFQN